MDGSADCGVSVTVFLEVEGESGYFAMEGGGFVDWWGRWDMNPLCRGFGNIPTTGSIRTYPQ